MFGQDVYYLPRELVNEDTIWGDDITSRFSSSYKIEMYLENTEGFDGEGDIFTKFGIEIRDQATFVVSRRRWSFLVGNVNNDITPDRPREGDLVYLPLSRSLFQIMAVEHEDPFYQLSKLPVYKLRTELFEYNDEDFDTNIPSIDSIERTGYEIVLALSDSDGTFEVGETVNQTLSSGIILNGEVTDWNDSDNIIKLAHIGSNDDEYHSFVVDLPIVGQSTSASRKVLSIGEELGWVENQNEDFKEAGWEFLDFSERNPFGEPEQS